jgi:hypothetical protein
MKCKFGNIFANSAFLTYNIDKSSFEHQIYDKLLKIWVMGSLRVIQYNDT